MTDTGQVPGEGLPESAGMVEQPGVHAPGAYTYLSETSAEDEELLLPGAQGAWGNEVPPPAPEPVVQVVHEPGPHETDGRDSGAVDLSAVRTSETRPVAPGAAPFRAPVAAPVPQSPVTRRPPYLAPPTPGTTPSPVRSLADRGPAGAPTPPAAVRHAAPPASGPEYLDAPQHAEATTGASPWVTVPAAAPVAVPVTAPAPAPVPEAPAPVATAAPAAEAAEDEAVEGEAVATQTVPTEQTVQDTEVQPEPEPQPEPAPGTAPAPQAEQPAETEAEVEVEVAVAVDGPAAGQEEPAEQSRSQEPTQEQEQQPAHELPVAEVPQAVQVADAPDVADVAEAQPEAQPQPVEQDAQPTEQDARPVDDRPAPAADEAVVPAPDAALPPEEEQPPAPAAEEQAGQQAQEAQEAVPAVPVEEDVAPLEAVAEAAPTAPAAHAVPLPDAVPSAQPLPDEQPLQTDEQPVRTEQLLHPEQPPQVEQPREAQPTDEPEVTDAEQPLAEEAPGATVPAPRRPEAPATAEPAPEPAAPHDAVHPAELHPDVAQSAEDLDTRAADQEDQEDQAPQQDLAPRQAPAHQQHQEDHHQQHHQHHQENQEEVSTAAVAEAREPIGPAAPGYDDAEREAVLRVMRERRDVRNGFRSDPIPHEVLLRVLEAAHTAPSVGHSQPWDFVVIRSAETRRAMHELAQRQRDAYAKSLPKGRAKQFKELKIEAILDTPVNIVVTADPTRGGRHTLGRHTQPQMAPYSSALAVENLWLAARAEGLGVGWVSFFDEREMVRVLGLPEHLEVVAYLCVGYVDEFPDEPELMQAGWSKRRPLSWVVHEETYGRRALPGAEPHDLLAETVAGIRPLDAKALGEAWERQKRMTKPAGALGMLEIISAQLSGLSRQCPPPIPEPAAVAVFAGDHGVHAQGVTPWPQEVTAQMVANFLGGGAVCNAFATQVGAEVCVVDVGVAAELPATPGLLPRKVRAGTADMTTGPALTREEVKQAIEVGIETARDLVAAGNKALLTGEMGIANTTASAALISVFADTDPAEVTGRGTGINDETLARKTEVVRRAIELHQPDPADPIGVLAAFGGLEHAAMVGLLLGGASLRTPVILDGVSAGAAALVARAIAPEVLAACIAGHRSAEPGHVAALKKLGLRPLVDLDLRLGEGTGALLALPMIQSTARAMHEVATFDSAGVTEK
ncbi:nicotinate-nucleotide--dimethylbenzimidazole phosphoribosyltransferase [Streptomyces sp. CRN 30]|uniref:nicotinate-nucleotide--dimethylbenzimidazole phosphoribosyltransferase n=1 Tax=Streptomyces sp. CRN 30 TaxID=3075613 RepID=UPI002A7F6A43|nr:nicotinate-nucleotide--dimethylbenzimidazole phosphoribosyltransferase [Streptomyces sp. CRN 30]